MADSAQRGQHVLTARRTIGAVLLAFLLLPWSGVLAPPAHAEEPELQEAPRRAGDPDHDARLQILIKHAIVFADGDLLSSGELVLTFEVERNCVGNECRSSVETPVSLVTSTISFSADSGDVVPLDRLIPRADDRLGAEVTEAFGLPVDAGVQYRLHLTLRESDGPIELNHYDPPGDVILEFSSDNDWRRGGHQYSTSYDLSPAVTIGYEVRSMSLPDLHPTAITVLDLPGSAENLVCMEVENIGPVEAGAFQAALRIDGALATNGIAEAGRLDAGQRGDLCVQTLLPESGQHKLSAVVDEPHGIIEINDRNNRLDKNLAEKRTAQLVGPGTGLIIEPADTVSNAPEQADLRVEAIRVKGKDPTGQNDCDPGKNDVMIVVKNQGTGGAGPSIVRVVVDNESSDADEQSVTSLDAGKTQDVLFDNIKLTKKQHTITATVDAKNAVPESKEDNNTKSVTVSCKEES